jgi:hypothetical protein
MAKPMMADPQDAVERSNSIAMEQIVPSELTGQGNWFERKLKPTKYTPRYPFVGKPLLWMTCGFGSLGDALFGYDSGIIMCEFLI